MYRVEMYYTVKALHEKGFSKRKIARELGIHRETVTAILEKVSIGKMDAEPVKKASLLDPYKSSILEWMEQDKSSVLIYAKLLQNFQLQVAYPTVVKYVRLLKSKIRAWLNYYSKFRRSELRHLFRDLNRHLGRWVSNKYRRFRRRHW